MGIRFRETLSVDYNKLEKRTLQLLEREVLQVFIILWVRFKTGADTFLFQYVEIDNNGISEF